MSAVQKLYDVTKQLLEIAGQAHSDEAREEQIISIEGLLEKREVLISSLNGAYTEEEKELGREALAMNTILVKKLELVKNAVKSDIQSLNNKKQNTQKYRNPYANVRSDGMFLDKRN